MDDSATSREHVDEDDDTNAKPFWSVKDTDIAKTQRHLLQTWTEILQRTPAVFQHADAYLSHDGKCFHKERKPSSTPLFPMQTVLMCRNALAPIVDHWQVYMGYGVCLSADIRGVRLVYITKWDRPTRAGKFQVKYVVTDPAALLHRAQQALGDYIWTPWLANCHTVSCWIVLGTRVSTPASFLTNGIMQATALSAVACLAVCGVIFLVVKSTTSHRHGSTTK